MAWRALYKSFDWNTVIFPPMFKTGRFENRSMPDDWSCCVTSRGHRGQVECHLAVLRCCDRALAVPGQHPVELRVRDAVGLGPELFELRALQHPQRRLLHEAAECARQWTDQTFAGAPVSVVTHVRFDVDLVEQAGRYLIGDIRLHRRVGRERLDGLHGSGSCP